MNLIAAFQSLRKKSSKIVDEAQSISYEEFRPKLTTLVQLVNSTKTQLPL